MSDARRKTILNVDDHEAGRYAVTRTLKASGFDVTEATTGADALRRAAELPDLVLLDVNLPDISGFEVCARIKADPRTAHLPVVHLSATYVGSDAVIEGLNRGADGYLTQPVDSRQLVATLNSILRLREAERELHEKAVLLDAVMRSTSDSVYVKDLEGRYLLFNAAAERVTGLAADEVLGRDDTALFPPGEAAEALARDRQTLESGEVTQFEETVTSAAGEQHTFLSAKGPLLDHEGRPYALFSVARDITERKRAQDEVRKLNAELEMRVEQRTVEYEAANRELEAFAYSVSHDLRAPLRAINGFSQVLLEDNSLQLDEAGRQHLERICSAANGMAGLIDDLLRLSRLSRGELHRAVVDLSALAAEIAEELSAAEPQRRMEFHIAEGLEVRADPELCRIILVNLLTNAVKFTSVHESARIEVGSEVRDGEQAFFVRDDGAGFDMAYADKLFRAFERLHSPGVFPGSGIGLATVSRIVRRHQGRVWAEGVVEGGATFWFTLPDGPT